MRIAHTGIAGVLVLLTACVADSDGRGSAAGESCTRTADCAAPLRCVSAVCVDPPDIGVDQGVDDEDGGTVIVLPNPDAAVDATPPPEFAPSYFIALAATVDPSKPLLFEGRPTVDPGDPPTLTLELQALSIEERRPVGDRFSATAALDGRARLAFGEVIIDGEADPIIPGARIVAEMTFVLSEDGDQLCGAVSGMISEPAMLPLEGTWGSSPAADDYLGLEPVTRCP